MAVEQMAIEMAEIIEMEAENEMQQDIYMMEENMITEGQTWVIKLNSVIDLILILSWGRPARDKVIIKWSFNFKAWVQEKCIFRIVLATRENQFSYNDRRCCIFIRYNKSY